MGRFVVALALSLALVGAGYYVAWEWGRPALVRAQESADWPRTQGWVETSRVERFARTGGRVEPRLELSYSYSVQGETYSGHRVRLPAPVPGVLQDGPQQLTGRYPAGLQVDVFYDPEDPSRAVLEPGAPAAAYLPILGGAALALVGAAAFAAGVVLGLKRAWARRPRAASRGRRRAHR